MTFCADGELGTCRARLACPEQCVQGTRHVCYGTTQQGIAYPALYAQAYSSGVQALAAYLIMVVLNLDYLIRYCTMMLLRESLLFGCIQVIFQHVSSPPSLVN